MKKRICDICKKNEASISFKTKMSVRMWNGPFEGKFTPYTTIDVCSDCGIKLLGLNPIPPIENQLYLNNNCF